MTALDAVTIDELCTTLGLRPPIGVRLSAPRPSTSAQVAALSDEQLTALNVLAHPDAIAVVTHRPPPQPFCRAVPVMCVIARRGAWVAEHVIEGSAHHPINAPTLLLERTGFATPEEIAPGLSLDVTVGAYRRMHELLRAGHSRRARAALVADGAAAAAAEALVNAVATAAVEVTGLANEGCRYVGCELAVVGDAVTGRWRVPTDATASPNLRTLIEPATADELVADLALIFGAV